MTLERTVRGVPFKINVDHQGKFVTHFQDGPVYAESLDKLITKLNTMTREAVSEIEIEFHRFYWNRPEARQSQNQMYGDKFELHPRIRPGKIVGFNVHQNGMIVDWKDQVKRKGQRGEVIHSYSYHREEIDLILEGEGEMDALKALVSAYDGAKKRLDAYLEERKVELRKLWDEQVAESTGGK